MLDSFSFSVKWLSFKLLNLFSVFWFEGVVTLCIDMIKSNLKRQLILTYNLDTKLKQDVQKKCVKYFYCYPTPSVKIEYQIS